MADLCGKFIDYNPSQVIRDVSSDTSLKHMYKDYKRKNKKAEFLLYYAVNNPSAKQFITAV